MPSAMAWHPPTERLGARPDPRPARERCSARILIARIALARMICAMKKLWFRDMWRPSLREGIVLGSGFPTTIISGALFVVEQDSEPTVPPGVAA